MQERLASTAIWAVVLLCAALIPATGNVEAPPQPTVTEAMWTMDVGSQDTTAGDGALHFDSQGPYSTNALFTCIPEEECCKICVKGKACGDTCISRNYTCHVGRGCACNSYEVC